MRNITEEQKTKDTYWYNNKGKYQNWLDENFSKLVPDIGNADTLEGELLRAANGIYYDLYNNDFCNNNSGAILFLLKQEKEFVTFPKKELRVLYDECNTGDYAWSNFFDEVEIVLNAVIELIISKNGVYTNNTVDYYDYQEVEYNPIYEDEIFEDDYHYCGYDDDDEFEEDE